MTTDHANDEAVYSNPAKLLWIGLGKLAVGLFMLGCLVAGVLRQEEPLPQTWWQWLIVFAIGGMFALFGIGACVYGLMDLRERRRQGAVLVFTDEGLVFPNGAHLPWDNICDAWIYSRAGHTNPFEEELNIVWVDEEGVESTYIMHTLGLTMPAEKIAEKILARIQSRGEETEGEGAARWVGD